MLEETTLLFSDWRYLAALAGVIGVLYTVRKYYSQSRLIEKQIVEIDSAKNPRIVVKTRSVDSGSKAIVISNRGKSAAFNLEIEFVDASSVPIHSSHMSKFPISQVPSMAERDFMTIASDQDPGHYLIRVKYQDSNEREYTEDFPVKLFNF